MRVIAGEFRSRALKSLPGLNTRPTPDRLREALFSVLQPRIDRAIFLDAYAGTGAVGIEALSRGAARAIFIEKDKRASDVIRENLHALGVLSRSEILRGRTAQYLAKRHADIVFLDPPYDLNHEYTETMQSLGQEPPPIVIAQHASRTSLEEVYGGLHRTRTLKQGDNSLSFYEPASTSL